MTTPARDSQDATPVERRRHHKDNHAQSVAEPNRRRRRGNLKASDGTLAAYAFLSPDEADFTPNESTLARKLAGVRS
jgi:hypothetical protein